MTRILLTIAILLTFAACDDSEPTALSETSPGGIEFTLLPMPGKRDVTIHVAWPTDWAYRDDTNKAAPQVGAQLILAGGAEGYAAGEVTERFADMNSDGIIHVAANDHVIGELTFERQNRDESVAAAHTHLLAPTLDPVWFDRIRDGLAQETAEAQAQPVHAGFDAMRWAVYGNQPLRNALSLDEPGTFDDLTRADIVAWHSETFTRNPEAVVVAGGIDAKDAGEAVDALLDGLPEGGAPLARDAARDFSPRRILLHRPDAEVTSLSFIGPLPPSRQGKEEEDLILINALASGDQSVLFEAARTELRASYGFDVGLASYSRDDRILYMTGDVETAKLAEAERVIRNAYADFRRNGPSGDLEDRKAELREAFDELADLVVAPARAELQGALDGFEPGLSLRLVDQINAVTTESVRQRLDEGFPGPDDLIMIAVSPDADALPDACVIRTPSEAVNCP